MEINKLKYENRFWVPYFEKGTEQENYINQILNKKKLQILQGIPLKKEISLSPTSVPIKESKAGEKKKANNKKKPPKKQTEKINLAKKKRMVEEKEKEKVEPKKNFPTEKNFLFDKINKIDHNLSSNLSCQSETPTLFGENSFLRANEESSNNGELFFQNNNSVITQNQFMTEISNKSRPFPFNENPGEGKHEFPRSNSDFLLMQGNSNDVFPLMSNSNNSNQIQENNSSYHLTPSNDGSKFFINFSPSQNHGNNSSNSNGFNIHNNSNSDAFLFHNPIHYGHFNNEILPSPFPNRNLDFDSPVRPLTTHSSDSDSLQSSPYFTSNEISKRKLDDISK